MSDCHLLVKLKKFVFKMTHYRTQTDESQNTSAPLVVNFLLDSLEAYQLQAPDSLFVSLTEFSKNSTSLTLEFEFTSNMPGRLKVINANNQNEIIYTSGETTYNYGAPANAHRQAVGGLSPSTEYLVISQTIINNSWGDVSLPTSFTTSAAVSAPGVGGTWPTASRNPALPFQGAMTGSQTHGSFLDHTIQQCPYSAVKYTFTRSGLVEAFGMHKRHEPTKPYSNGTGGDWNMSLWTVGADGLPNLKVAESDPNVPHLYGQPPINGSSMLWVEMETPVQVEAGETYWIMREVKNPSDGYSVWNGHNYGRYLQTVNGIEVVGPWPKGEIGLRLIYRNTKSEAWRNEGDRHIMPFLPIRYSDGYYDGNYYTYYAGSITHPVGTLSGSRYIGGSIRARQRVVQNGSMIIDGVWVYYGHTNLGAISGAPLRIDVKNSGGTILSYANVPASEQLSNMILGNSGFSYINGKTWGYAPLFSPVSLSDGQVWYAELSCTGGQDYVIATGFPTLDTSYANGIPTNSMKWGDELRVSVNNGSTWGNWADNYNNVRELPLKFTVQGNPRSF